MSKGQINFEDDALGKKIVELASLPEVRTIVEIGTWNGLGSTRCVLEGVKNKTDYNFLSFECSSEMFLQAVANNKDFINKNFNIVLGKLVNEDNIDKWFGSEEMLPEHPQELVKGWLDHDKKCMSLIPNYFFAVPSYIDLLILDGGEFSTYLEWQLLKDRANYVVLDDTRSLKCSKIRQEVQLSNLYTILEDNLHSRHGFMIIKKN